MMTEQPADVVGMDELSDRPKITAPLLSVVMDDGATFKVQSDNRDLLAFDMQRSRRKWPDPANAPFVWLTFLAWSARRRETPDVGTWEDFSGHALDVSAEGTEDADPSPSGAMPE